VVVAVEAGVEERPWARRKAVEEVVETPSAHRQGAEVVAVVEERPSAHLQVAVEEEVVEERPSAHLQVAEEEEAVVERPSARRQAVEEEAAEKPSALRQMVAAARPVTTSVDPSLRPSQLDRALLSIPLRKLPGGGRQDRLRGAFAGPPG
jgi:hypothetical protein